MNNSTFIAKFFEHDRPHFGLKSYARLMMDQNTLYSYGHHFPLATETENGEYILNGDRYSVTTSKHQGKTIYHAHNFQQKPYVIIPQSVLDTAYLETKKLKIVDKREDLYRTVKRRNPETGKMEDHEEHLLGAAVVRYGDRYFLSGTDEGAAHWGRAYFLTELVKPAQTIKDAFQSLKPDKVLVVSDFKRQGEWFFIPIGTTKEVRSLGEHPIKKFGLVQKHALLPETIAYRNGHHVATEFVSTPEGPYVRGTIRHNRRDHRMLKLGKVWHLAVHNLQVQSWSTDGRVD